MPYIPPPRPPPAPPRIVPPPVFRPPPGPNIHQQNIHRQQQQQQAFHRQQQQQAFHRQQQQQAFHRQQQQFQRQEEQRRFHQQQQLQRQLQADNQRRQQNQQQFLRQQEMQRQQQEQLRRQQQLHQDNLHRQNDHQRQQALLRDFHSSTEGTGPTVVHVAPNITLEVSGALAQGLTLNSNASFEFNSAPDTGPGGSTPSAPPQSPGAAPPANLDTGSLTGPPPPYFQQTPLPSPGVQSPSPQQPSSPPPPPLPAAVQVSDPQNRILLSDGTQIVIKSEAEYLFVGPTGVPMVVNCLPLYDPPPNALENRPVKAGTISVNPSSLSFPSSEKNPLRKTQSSEDILESKSVANTALLSDEEDGDGGAKSDDEQLKTVAKNRQNWSRFSSSYGANYSIRLRETAKSDSSLDRSSSTDREMSPSTCNRPRSQSFDENFVASKLKLKEKKRLSQSVSQGESNDKAPKTTSQPEQGDVPKIENGLTTGSTDSESLEKPTAEGEDSSDVKSKPVGNRKHTESTSSETENTDAFSVNYLGSTQEISVELKRSSGSVSFLKSTSIRRQTSPPPAPANNTPKPCDEASDTTTSNAAPSSSTSDPARDTSADDSTAVSTTGNTALENTASNCGEDTSSDATDGAMASNEQAAPNDGSSQAADSSVPDTQPSKSAPNNEKVALEQEAVEILAQSSSTPSAPASGDTPLATPPGASQTAKVPLSPPGTNPLSSSSSSSSSYLPLSPSEAAQKANLARAKAARIPTSLPPSPLTIEPSYMERSGWLNKLSHRKGVFGDKWQKRYFVLHGSQLYYFKKYGDSSPKGIIKLLPTGWCKAVPQGTRRMSDAVVTSAQEAKPAVISVLRCLCVHRPSNFASSLSTLLATDGVAEAFHSQTISVSNTEHASRTFYMVSSSNEERDAWVEAVQNNIKAYAYSSEALTAASKELRNMLRAVSCQLPLKETPPLLYHLHARRRALVASQETLS